MNDNQKNKGTLLSQTFKVGEKKMPSEFRFLANWPRAFSHNENRQMANLHQNSMNTDISEDTMGYLTNLSDLVSLGIFSDKLLCKHSDFVPTLLEVP